MDANRFQRFKEACSRQEVYPVLELRGTQRLVPCLQEARTGWQIMDSVIVLDANGASARPAIKGDEVLVVTDEGLVLMIVE